MANILDYLEWRCDVPLAVDPFNEVDNLVLSELVYTDFRGILSMDARAVPLRDAADAFFQTHDREEILESKSFTARAPLLMEKMLEGERFRGVKLCWYQDETDTEQAMQFAAVTFLLPDGSAYVAFRGTDGTLVGWREDANGYWPSTTTTGPASTRRCSRPRAIGGSCRSSSESSRKPPSSG